MQTSLSAHFRVVDAALYFLPVEMRVPLKFGDQVLSTITCARAAVKMIDGQGRTAIGWGETPLSVGWVWPAELAFAVRHERLNGFCCKLGEAFRDFQGQGHALEIGHAFLEKRMPELLLSENAATDSEAAMPHLAALVAFSPFDIATHDACGLLLQRPVFETYGPGCLNSRLDEFLESAMSTVDFSKKTPEDFLRPRQNRLPVWHLVGGLDPLEKDDLLGNEPDDGYPVLLRDWIRRDGLDCLKIKLRGNDSRWDLDRVVKVAAIAREEGVSHLTVDFNCMVTEPDYVNAILDELAADHPWVFERILYVEQPFPYDLETYRINVHTVSDRKPLFLDESAHDWRFVRLGRELGWTGVALKTCKTQTGALLSLCWARAHGMDLMVQDLTNPMLAQIPHVLLAAHAGTIMGVESNGMQFYPAASLPEERVHPGLFRRRRGILDACTVNGPGFGYQTDKIGRSLEEPIVAFRDA